MRGCYSQVWEMMNSFAWLGCRVYLREKVKLGKEVGGSSWQAFNASLGKLDSTPQTTGATKWLYEEKKEDQICIFRKITQ